MRILILITFTVQEVLKATWTFAFSALGNIINILRYIQHILKTQLQDLYSFVYSKVIFLCI